VVARMTAGAAGLFVLLSLSARGVRDRDRQLPV
jgi:hypothetical protein